MSSYRKIVFILSYLSLSLSISFAQDDILRSVNCRFRVPERATIECMMLSVPENRANPDSLMIDLSLAILRNPSDNPEPDPIIFLQGGPGGDTLDTLYATYAERFEPLFATNRDIILFDQRGTGYSHPVLECPVFRHTENSLLDYDLYGQLLSRPEVETYLHTALIECGETLSRSHDLSGYNSIQNAGDIEAIRQALGYEQLNLWGISYGSRLALTAMRDYPDSFRRVVLDGVYPLDVNLSTELPANFDRALQVLFDRCEQDSLCNETYPDLESVLFDTVARLNEQPVRFDTLNPYTRETYDNIFYNGDLMLHTLFQLLYVTDILPRLPELIVDVSEGRWDIWILLVGQSLAWHENLAIGMHYAVQCQEEFYFTEPGSIRSVWENYPKFSTYSQRIEFFEPLSEICESFRAGVSPDSENQAVSSTIPALLMAGEYDPVTPPHWAEQVSVQLDNSLYLEFVAHGHGVSAFRGCAYDIMLDFFRLEDISALDTSCMTGIQMRYSGIRQDDNRFFDSADSGVEAGS